MGAAVSMAMTRTFALADEDREFSANALHCACEKHSLPREAGEGWGGGVEGSLPPPGLPARCRGRSDGAGAVISMDMTRTLALADEDREFNSGVPDGA